MAWWRFVARWRSDRLALAIDPALKGKETTAIVISVVCRGCAIPVARRIMRANKPGAWMDPVVELLQAGPGGPGGDEGDCAVRPGPDQSGIVGTDTRPEPAPGHDRRAGIHT